MGTNLESNFDQVFTSQQIYRLLLDAMARPGKIVTLARLEIDPPEGLSWSIAGLAFTLLDQETTFAALPDHESWGHYLCLNTGSRQAAVSEAEFIIIDGRVDLPELLVVNRGDLLFPDRGATLMVMVSSVGGAGADTRLTLQGPGIPGQASLTLGGLCPGNLERVQTLNREFPLGVDLMISDNRGALVCIPRSSAITAEVNG
ncbi:MAG: phosphonate C-P lyase system protein PhnH [Thermacetogeniaceae bacterium]|jgi:alpha-D-ribose 1-methylphosphonate 5-triphosphate synthase subunit PhnH